MSNTPWLDLAYKELGTKEIVGPEDNPVVLQYFKDAGFSGINNDETAWCAAFVGAMLHRTGYKRTNSLLARSYTSLKKLSEPVIGCIVVFKRGDSNWQGHVGFYVGETGSYVKSLGGNQSNSVNISKYSKSKLIGYYWPQRIDGRVEEIPAAPVPSNPLAWETLEKEYNLLLRSMTYKNEWWENYFKREASKLTQHKDTYKEIEKETGVPWYFIACIHNLESSGDFNKHLHNGDSLKARTVRKPAGHPKEGSPPFTFKESAIDALKIKGYDKETNWSLARMCYLLEKYNGWGYRKNFPYVKSPYLWSGTNHYRQGKYITDGKFSHETVSKQAGAAPLLVLLSEDKDEQQNLPIDSSRKLKSNFWLRRLSELIAGVSVLSLETFDGKADVVVTILVMLALFYCYSKLQDWWQKQDFKEGRYIPRARKWLKEKL